ncbi:MAG: 5'/3'-nucleotidase SurE [Candidatus Omnitrophica bacterium]|nr:5'/3'-nucleotidase SurE [Candidatus Omnitrophota bacterium]
MDILLTNDDGINAEGLYTLSSRIKEIANINIVAPDAERSAVGHAITILDPLRVTRVRRNGSFYGHAVSGTPADCVKIAVRSLLDVKPDMVISGINRGPNTGVSVLYSGTVSAATEAALLGIPSIAVSLATYTDPDFSFAADFIKKLIPQLQKKQLPGGTLLNINIPAVAAKDIKGVSFTKQSNSHFIEEFTKRVDPRGNTYYWLGGEMELLGDNTGSDCEAVKDNRISITPLHFDLTDHEFLEKLQDWKIDI